MIPRHDEGARPEAHGLELVQPGALPILVLDLAETDLRPVQSRVEGLQRGEQGQGFGVGVEQGGQYQRFPQRRLAHAGLEDGVLVAGVGIGIQQRDRQRADILQGGLVARLLDFGAAQGEFQIGHARYEGRGQAAIVSCAFRTRGDERRDGARRRARGALKGLDAARIMVACPGSC